MKTIIAIIKQSNLKIHTLLMCFILAVISSGLSIIPTQFLGYSISIITGEQNIIRENIFNALNITHNSKYMIAVYSLVLFFITTLFFIIFRNIFCTIVKIISDKIILNLRKKLYSKLLKMKFTDIIEKSKGDIIHTIINETQRLEYLFSVPLYTLFSDFFDIVWISIYFIIVDPIVLLILFSIIPFLYVVSIITGKKQKNVSKNIQALTSKQTETVEQTITGIETIKAFNGYEYEENRYNKFISSALETKKRGTFSLSGFFIIEGMLRSIGLCLVLIYVICNIKNNLMPIGMITVVLLYSNKIYTPIRNITSYYQTVQSGIIAGDKILKFLDYSEENIISSNLREQTINNSIIEINNLTYQLDNNMIYKDFSFKCFQNEIILLNGKSGIGKTSLFRILLGLYKVKENTVFINGKDINKYSEYDLRNIFSYSSQHSFLHNDTLINNISYPGKLDKKHDIEIMTLITKLNLNHIRDNSLIGEVFNKLSGGEKKRISFARAITKGKKILLLDEVTTELDKNNINTVLNILTSLKGKCTILLISHSNDYRLLKLADRIITLDTKI